MTIANASMRREWRQFRLLARDSVRTLINAAILSRDADPVQFALWMVAVVATPPSMFAFSQMIRYTSLKASPPDVVLSVALTHRMFFVLYGMLASAMLAALLWEALFPNRDDQEILGALPVRPGTVAAARLAAALGIVLTFSATIAAPSAVVFAVIATTHPVLGFLPTVFVAHLAATMGGCVFVFVALLVARALVALAISADAAERLATGLQLVTVVGLVDVFLYFPTVLPRLVAVMLDGGGWAVALPPVWFGALYSFIVGAGVPGLGPNAAIGAAALLAVSAAVVPLYLLPARLMARRALESRPRPRAGLAAAAVRATRRTALAPPTAAILAFTLSSLVRNRRHLLIVVSYAGIGLAVGLVSVLTASLLGRWRPAVPDETLLSLPLVLLFVLTFGLRSAFAVPTDLDANWPFRLATPPVEMATHATRLALLILAVCPVVLGLVAVTTLLGWPIAAIAMTAVFDLAAGWLVVECAVHERPRIPFACTHTPAPETVKTGWLVFMFALYLFAFRGASAQAAALESNTAGAIYLACVGGASTLLCLWHARRARRLTVLFEEEAESTLSTLSLSEALR